MIWGLRAWALGFLVLGYRVGARSLGRAEGEGLGRGGSEIVLGV